MTKENKLEKIVPVRLNDDQLEFLGGSEAMMINMRSIIDKQRMIDQVCSTDQQLSGIEQEIKDLKEEKAQLLSERTNLFKKIRAAMQYQTEKPLQSYRKTFRFSCRDYAYIQEQDGTTISDKVRRLIDEHRLMQMGEHDDIPADDQQLLQIKRELFHRKSEVKNQVEILREIQRLEKELLEKYAELADETGERFKNII